MAVAVTPRTLTTRDMQLENDLKYVEDDLGSFIKTQKDILLKDKLQLERTKSNKYGQQKIDLQISPPRLMQKMVVIKKNENNNKTNNDHDGSLNFGGYENKQKVLRNERQKEYQQYLEQQSRTRGGKNKKKETDPIEQRCKNRKEYRSDIDKEYGKLLKNKKNEELLYNHQNGIEYEFEPPKHGKKVIEFDESDDELFNYVLREKAKTKNNQRSVSGRNSNLKTSYPDDGRSSSVPPPVVPSIFDGIDRGARARQKSHQQHEQQQNQNAPYVFGGPSATALRKQRDLEYKLALENQMNEKQNTNKKFDYNSSQNQDGKAPYVFGGSSHSVLRKEKNMEYKQALEEQIKQKEEEKKREKLKRMGRLTSDMVMGNDISPNRKDQIVQYSDQNIANNVSPHPQETSNNVSQQHAMQTQNTNLTNYAMNPAFHNPMMNYPMGWPAYGTMTQNGFIPGNVMGLQQMPTNMQVNGAQYNGQNITNDRYVPSAMDDNTPERPGSHKAERKTVDKGGAKRNSLVPNIALGESPQIPNVSAKRAQQIAYQQELRQQMEIKKATAVREKKERERYEMKLEQEIAIYDPWGKSGCGAPVRTKDGKVVADLKRVLQGNEDVPDTPDAEVSDVSPMMKALALSQDIESKEYVVDKGIVDKAYELNKEDDGSPGYGRGAALKELKGQHLLSPRDKKDQNSYKDFLQQQVEEKKRKDEEIKEKARIEEEKENKRLQDQQKRMREEYEQEKEKQRKKAEEVRKQNEELRRVAEQKKLDEEMRLKKMEEEKEAERKRQAEKEAAGKREEAELNQSNGMANGIHQSPEQVSRSPVRPYSPPVPAVRTNKRRSMQENQQIENNSEKETIDYLNTIRQSLSNHQNNIISNDFVSKPKEEVKNTHVQEQQHLIRQLSALRKQLLRQEVRVQNDLENTSKTKYDILAKDNAAILQPKSVTKRNPFDRATRSTSGRKRLNGNKDFNHLPYGDFDNAQKDLDSQQQEYMRQQEMRIAALRHGVESKTLPIDFKMNRQASKQSLLESESKFISMDTHGEVTDFNTKINSHRTKKKSMSSRKVENPSPKHENHLRVENNFYEDDNVSITTVQVEDISRKNDERLANLTFDYISEDVQEQPPESFDKLHDTNAENENLLQNFMQQNQRYEVR